MRMSDHRTAFVHPDFIPRSYSRPIRELSIVYTVAVIAIIFLCNYGHLIGGTATASVLITLIIVGLALYTIFRRQQHNDQMMATEFENLLFSAAASLGSAFCIFLRADGTIVYANDGARRMFPRVGYEEGRALDALLLQGKVEKADQDKLHSAMSRGQKESLVLGITDADKTRRDFVLTIDPLRRPAGYYVLRGREYYTERKVIAKLTGRLQKTTPEKVGSLLQHIPFPLYIVSTSGVLEYVNPALEHMAGFGENEMLETGMTLQKLIYHADGFETGEFEPVEFNGAALISCRNGSLAKAQLHQFICHDEFDRFNGCCGILYV